jgi:nucleoside-diphosphate-sugar epimerase
MKILITGGGGFLGFRLAKALLARGKLNGKSITGITLLDGAFPSAAATEPRLKAVTGDVSDEKVIASVCRWRESQCSTRRFGTASNRRARA